VIYSHPLLSVALTKLYNVMLLTAYMYQTLLVIVILYQYRKIDHCTKPENCSEFCGIAISPIISKIFEPYIRDRFDSFLGSNDNQFGLLQFRLRH
jgi:hypothetical protein